MKRGAIALQTSWLIDLIFVATIIVIFFSVNLKVQDNEINKLKYQARDYAYILDVSSLQQGNLNYAYSKNPKYTIKEENCEISVSIKDSIALPEKYYCSGKNTDIEKTYGENEITIKNA